LNVRTIELPCIHDSRGDLAFAEAERHVPFAIRRVFLLFGVPGDSVRGRHAHRRLHQVFVAVGGSFDVTVTDGTERAKVRLDAPSRALHVEPMIWSELHDFTPGASCLVLASEYFEEADYIRDYDDFLRAVGR
jgi:hypothetical protein